MLTRTNANKRHILTHVLADVGVQHREAKVPMCFFDARSMFSAMEINYPLYMSPIELYPEALCIEQAQQIYYNMMEDMAVRTGPELPLRKPARIEQIDYSKRTALVAPPVLFQVRKSASACPFRYSDVWLREQQAFVQNEVCARHSCEDVHAPMSCSGRGLGLESNATFFGNRPMDLGEERGFAELLGAVVNTEQVFREGRLQLTENLLDVHTSLIKALLTFFSPETGVVALLAVYAHVDKPDGVEAHYELDFFNMLDGQLLSEYLVYESVALVISAGLVLRAVVRLLQYFGWCGLRAHRADSAQKSSGNCMRNLQACRNLEVIDCLMGCHVGGDLGHADGGGRR